MSSRNRIQPRHLTSGLAAISGLLFFMTAVSAVVNAQDYAVALLFLGLTAMTALIAVLMNLGSSDGDKKDYRDE